MVSTDPVPQNGKGKADEKMDSHKTGSDTQDEHASAQSGTWEPSAGKTAPQENGAGKEAKAEARLRDEWLANTIEGEIIPRLLMAHSSAISQTVVAYDHDDDVQDREQSEFFRLLMSPDENAAMSYVEDMRAKGTPLESIYLDLMAPVARLLGDGWSDDSLTFTDVTVGLGRLHRMIHELRGNADTGNGPRIVPSKAERRILLAPAPPEQHTLGLLMVADFFRRAGWSVWEEPSTTAEDLIAMVSTAPYDIVGLSLACERWLDEVKSALGTIRSRSANPKVKIILGGRIFSDKPELALQLGADAAAPDSRNAVSLAEQLIEAAIDTRYTAKS